MKNYIKLTIVFAFIILMISGCKSKSVISLDDEKLKYDSDIIDLSAIESNLGKASIVFVGERHGVKENYDIKKQFIMYLKENNYMNYLLIESSPADSHCINRYLKTGDETIIKGMFKELQGTFSWNKENYQFYKWLYKYNETLSEKDKITVVGSDIVHQYKTALSELKLILGNHKFPSQLKDDLAQLMKLNNDSDILREELYRLTKAIYDKMLEDEEFYLDYYKQDFVHIYTTMLAMHLGIEAYDNNGDGFEHFTKYRDLAMYKIFDIYERYIDEGRYFGQWGNSHTYTKNMDETQWFGAYLNDDSRFSGKIFTVLLLYDDCRCMTRGKSYGTAKFDEYEGNDKIINSLYSASYKLYKLNNPKTIFAEELRNTFFYYKKPKDGVTTDYFQYFIRVYKGIPTTPFN